MGHVRNICPALAPAMTVVKRHIGTLAQVRDGITDAHARLFCNEERGRVLDFGALMGFAVQAWTRAGISRRQAKADHRHVIATVFIALVLDKFIPDQFALFVHWQVLEGQE